MGCPGPLSLGACDGSIVRIGHFRVNPREMVITYHIFKNYTTYQDLGSDYFDQRQSATFRTRFGPMRERMLALAKPFMDEGRLRIFCSSYQTNLADALSYAGHVPVQLHPEPTGGAAGDGVGDPGPGEEAEAEGEPRGKRGRPGGKTEVPGTRPGQICHNYSESCSDL